MFNRSEILRSAWAAYRLARPAVFAAGDETGSRAFLRPFFAKMLRRAWEDAKAEASTANAREATRLATELQARIRASQADLAARMDPMARSARIVEIRGELQVLDYAPWGVRTSQRRADLGIELQLLETTAAASQSLAA
ncbi:MAG TPA: hypothetical protein VGV07_21895 [Devosia sp.]|jgi:hypothetical protein|uniref:hypothetical protein n=1 Tax=Devosia sp. TaxID=1871048 RepID=UPI002DDDB7AE|nr:hypothetical protein [Devosia sp.]HEV2517920.1 hypothetical protein [Devosia sp.]